MSSPEPAVSHWKEYRAAICATLVTVSAGCSVGWTSPTLYQLEHEGSLIPITEDQGSWIVSMMILCSTVSALPAGYLADRYGRKTLLLSSAIPFIGGWTMIITASTVAELYVSRILCGLGYGIIYTTIPMYLGEVTSDSVRGSTSIINTVMNKLGILSQYCIGPYVTIKGLAGINLAVPLIFIILFIWLPESPYYFMKEGKSSLAGDHLRRLRWSSNIDDELAKIKGIVDNDMANKGRLVDLLSNRSNRTALIHAIMLHATQQFCGSTAMVAYTQIIFEHAGGTIEPGNASIIIGCVQVLAAISTVFTVDRVGRRPLLLVSSLGVCSMNVAIGTFFFYKDFKSYDMESLGFFPVVAMVIYIISYAIGLSTVPLAVTAEIFPTNVKSYATSVIQIFVGLATFVVTKLFQVVGDNFGTFVAFWIFAVCSLLGLIYIYFQLPETKGKSFAEIQNDLRKKQRNDSAMKDHKSSLTY